MRYDFKFAGRSLSEFVGVTTARPPHETAKPDQTRVEIPGHSGDVIIDRKRFKNVSFTRRIGYIKSRLPDQSVDKIIEWLGYLSGYHEFEDTDHPGLVTYAVLEDFGDIRSELELYLKADLKFSRIPFWYSKSALVQSIELPDTETLQSGILLHNPYPIASAPLIRVELNPDVFNHPSFFRIRYGDVLFRYNTNQFPLGASSAEFRKYVYFDCDSGVVYTKQYGTEDEAVQYADADPPELLEPGDTLFGLEHGAGTVVINMNIIPRWRCL